MRYKWFVFVLKIFSITAMANTTEADLEIIEVKAQKRIESIQDIPISLTAIDPNIADKLHLPNVSDLGALTPNLNVTRSIGGSYNFFIRGIGMDEFNLSSVPAIGLYIDEVAVINPMLASFSLFDVTQIEILRGPQNTLYGKNTTGGAINVYTHQPTIVEPQASQISLTLGNHELVHLKGAATWSNDDDLAVRFAGFSHQREGILEGTVQPRKDFHNINRFGVRLNANWQLADSIEFQAGLTLGKQKQISEIKTLIRAHDDTGVIDLSRANLDQVSTAFIDPPNDIDAVAGHFKIQWQMDWANLNSITSFEHVQSERKDDWGAQNAPSSVYQIATFNATETTNYAQEFQLISNGSVDWIAGVLFSQESGDLLQTAYIDPAGPGRPDDAVPDAGIGPLFDRGSWVEQDTFNVSVYGQLAQPITDKLTLTIGLRATHQSLTPTVNAAGMLMDSPDRPFPLGTFGWYSVGNPEFDVFTDFAGFDDIERFVETNGGFPASAKIDKTFKEWGGKLALTYQFDSNTMGYASIARGFKMGAVNSNPTTSSFISLLDKVVEPELLITKELGIKSLAFNGQMRINAAIFENKWQQYQFYQVYNPGNPAQLFAALVNLPEAESYGAELEVNWLPSPDWRIDLGLGLLKTKVVNGTLNVDGIPEDSQQGFQNSVVSGNELTNAPDVTTNISIHRFVDLEYGELDLLLHYQYVGEHIHQLAGVNSTVWQENMTEKSVGIWSVNTAFSFGNASQYQIALWLKNITDERYCLERAIIPGLSAETDRLCAQSEPSSAGLSLKVEL